MLYHLKILKNCPKFSVYSKAYNYLYTRVGEVRKPRQRGGEDSYTLKC